MHAFSFSFVHTSACSPRWNGVSGQQDWTRCSAHLLQPLNNNNYYLNWGLAWFCFCFFSQQKNVKIAIIQKYPNQVIIYALPGLFHAHKSDTLHEWLESCLLTGINTCFIFEGRIIVALVSLYSWKMVMKTQWSFFSLYLFNRECYKYPRWGRLYTSDVGSCTWTNCCCWVSAAKRTEKKYFISFRPCYSLTDTHTHCFLHCRVLIPTFLLKGEKVHYPWPVVKDTLILWRCSLTVVSMSMNMIG